MKQCIFYLPYKLDEHGSGARMLRPRKMIQAFREIGYNVFVIQGYSDERRKRIKELKKQMANGSQYDFMYTESHTEPTLLTNPNHLPTHPFLDYGFFRYIKNCGIKIGLFYCDVYWRFDTYGKDLPQWKRISALKCYEYDIKKYTKLLDKFYVADYRVSECVGNNILTKITDELPPGADNLEIGDKTLTRKKTERVLELFYVGGLGGNYQIIELVKAVHCLDQVHLTICCRQAEWDKERHKFADYLDERISIVHHTNDELEEYYSNTDVCSLLFQRGTYIDFSRPYKAYEYLAHEIPVLVTDGTGIGVFVKENDIGWNIPYEKDSIMDILQEIINSPDELEKKRNNCKKAKQENLWTIRAMKVANDLMSKKA